MKPRYILCLALGLICGLFGCSTAANTGSADAPNHPSDLPLRYQNAEYDFTFSLPADWQGYSVLIQQWHGETYSPAADKSVATSRGRMIVLRHPQWKAGDPYQDIPVLVFTRNQWDTFHQGQMDLHAGGVVYEMWHSQKYVFGIHSRYNADDSVKGWREAVAILDRNCAANNGPHLYPE